MKTFIQKQIEEGGQIKGLEGLIPGMPNLSGKCKSEIEFYVPVIVTGVETEGCGKLYLKIETKPGNVFYRAGVNIVGVIPPADFYKDIEEVERIERHRAKVQEYKEELSRLSSNYGNRLVSVRRASLIDLYERSTDGARAIVDKELEELKVTLKKVDTSKFEPFAKILATAIYFPNGMDEDDAEDSE